MLKLLSYNLIYCFFHKINNGNYNASEQNQKLKNCQYYELFPKDSYKNKVLVKKSFCSMWMVINTAETLWTKNTGKVLI